MICSLTKVPSGLEYLDTIVHAVADIEQAIVRELRAVHRAAELLIDRRVRIVIAGVGVVRLVAIGAPMPLVLAGVGVEHDDAFVAVAVGDVQLIGFRIDKQSSPALSDFPYRCCPCSGTDARFASGIFRPCVNFRT